MCTAGSSNGYATYIYAWWKHYLADDVNKVFVNLGIGKNIQRKNEKGLLHTNRQSNKTCAKHAEWISNLVYLMIN